MYSKGAQALVIAVVAVVAVAVVVMVGIGGAGGRRTPLALDAPTGAPTFVMTTQTPWIVTPPPVRKLHTLHSGQDVMEYLHALADPDNTWVETHVRRARRSDIELMMAGPGAHYVTPGPGTALAGIAPDSAEGMQVMWIVGVRAETPVSPDRLQEAQLMYERRDSPAAQPSGSEFWFIVDDAGAVVSTGFLNQEDGQGVVTHYAAWNLADIDSLPPP